INYKMMTSLSAGLMSFLIDGSRTMMFAGTRSAGKSSILGATLTELMKKVRIITVEDTLELPVKALKDLGYDIQSLKSRSIITHVESELSADEAIRTSLRLGDSALIVGEVRSVEAKALYESMRIGALANIVAGTIHGDSPYGVFDRVVNDLGVPPTSFKATDIIVIVNRLKSADGLRTYRRIMEITEVTKDWDENPQKEKAFQPLMKYDSKTDRLEPTDRFLNGESLILNEIADRVKDWKNNWDSVWENIQLRTKVKEALLNYAKVSKDFGILEAEFTTEANSRFHLISQDVKEQYGALDTDRIFERWDAWTKQKVKDRQRLMKG
ncbi:MAG: type II/IV secretion system ATPase subunit, partial [Candidatus Aenigmarchaeota archaeon]|nr:type II/IV secretion system ATPase subunit [Candidatus Aenigmarchaeota archaeon]